MDGSAVFALFEIREPLSKIFSTQNKNKTRIEISGKSLALSTEKNSHGRVVFRCVSGTKSNVINRVLGQ